MKKKKFIEIAVISFLAVALLVGLLIGFVSLIDPDTKLIDSLGTFIGIVLLIYIPMMIVLFFSIFSFKIGKKVARIEANQIDFNKEKNYYRDILKGYSVPLLSYIENMDINENDIMATLLDLELKGVVKLNDYRIKIIDDTKRITHGEEYILNKCKSGKVNIDKKSEYINIVKTEAINNGLIIKEKNILKDIISMFIKTNIFSFITVVLLIIFVELVMNEMGGILMTIFALVLMMLIIFSMFRWVYFVSYVIHKFKSYELTEKGRKIKEKLDGLKLYIKDFGDLQDDDKKSLTLWEEYLIYSVMFESNDVIKKDMKDLINIKYNFNISKKNIFIIAFVLALLFFMYIGR